MNTTNLTTDQRDLYGFLADRLRWFRGLTPMPAADVAAVLEAVAFSLRTGGKGETFTLPDRFTPAVRMTQRSMHVDPQAQKYLADKMRIGHGLIAQLDGRDRPLLPASTPLAVRLEIPRADHRRDLSNELKAIEDAANGILYRDDRWIDHITATRGQGDRAQVSVGVME